MVSGTHALYTIFQLQLGCRGAAVPISEAWLASWEAWLAFLEAWLAGSEACLAGSKACLAGSWALEGGNVWTENLPILQDFVPYQGRCPACPHENQGESRAGQGNR